MSQTAIAVLSPHCPLPPIPEYTTGLSPARKAIWAVMYRRCRKWEGWSSVELQDFVTELEGVVVRAGAPR